MDSETEVVAPTAASRRRWGIVALLFAATLLNYLDRQVLSVTSPILRVEFHLSAIDYSHLLSTFLLGYTVVQAFASRLVDRLGARNGLLLAMIWWSLSGMAAAIAHGPLFLGACLFLMGVGESANWPASVKTTQQWFVARERGVAIAVFNCGSAAGAVLAPPLLTLLALRYSWRAAFAVSGAVGVLWIAPWLWCFRRGSVQDSDPQPQHTAGRGWLAMLSRRNTLALMSARFFADPVWIFFIFWLPDYLSRSRHFSLKEIGATAWLPFLAAGIGNLLGGYVSGRFVAGGTDPRRARLYVMSGAAALMLSGVAITFLASPIATLATICLVTFAYSCWAANVLTLPSDLFPRNEIAWVVGLTGTAAGLGGILIMLLVGFLIDHVSYRPVLIGISCLPLLALACVASTRVDSSAPGEATR